jgi:hypothetical protein
MSGTRKTPTRVITISVFKQFEVAFAAWDLDAMLPCFHPDWKFHMHPSGKTLKLAEWNLIFGKILSNTARERGRSLYENQDILAPHNFATFPKSCVDAVM